MAANRILWGYQKVPLATGSGGVGAARLIERADVGFGVGFKRSIVERLNASDMSGERYEASVAC